MSSISPTARKPLAIVVCYLIASSSYWGGNFDAGEGFLADVGIESPGSAARVLILRAAFFQRLVDAYVQGVVGICQLVFELIQSAEVDPHHPRLDHADMVDGCLACFFGLNDRLQSGRGQHIDDLAGYNDVVIDKAENHITIADDLLRIGVDDLQGNNGFRVVVRKTFRQINGPVFWRVCVMVSIKYHSGDSVM